MAKGKNKEYERKWKLKEKKEKIIKRDAPSTRLTARPERA
jgi:hypothetical protein